MLRKRRAIPTTTTLPYAERDYYPMIPVPHYHVVRRRGYDIWTYLAGVRRRTSWLVANGERPVILTCHGPRCLIYIPDGQGKLSEEVIHARLDQVRHAS